MRGWFAFGLTWVLAWTAGAAEKPAPEPGKAAATPPTVVLVAPSAEFAKHRHQDVIGELVTSALLSADFEVVDEPSLKAARAEGKDAPAPLPVVPALVLTFEGRLEKAKAGGTDSLSAVMLIRGIERGSGRKVVASVATSAPRTGAFAGEELAALQEACQEAMKKAVEQLNDYREKRAGAAP